MRKHRKSYAFFLLFSLILMSAADVLLCILLFKNPSFRNLTVLPAGILAVLWICFIQKIVNPLLRTYRQCRTSPDESLQKMTLSEYLRLSLSGSWTHFVSKNAELTRKEYELQLNLNQAKFNNLQSQINPHFLYNSLDSIRGLAMIEGADRAADMAEALGAFFRYNISHSVDIVQIREELQNIHNYFLIQTFRFGDRFRLKLDFDTEDETIQHYPIPKMTLQPLVENSIFHGLEKKVGGGTVTIGIEITSSRLYIRVADDGVGMTPEQLHSLNSSIRENRELSPEETRFHNGVALVNINRRISDLYGNAYGLHITSTENIGTEAEITLPYPPAERGRHPL